MAYTRVPPLSGAGAIVSKPTTQPIPVSDLATTDYHPIPGATGITNQPPNATAPNISASDLTQSTGSYVVFDNVRFTATTNDLTDFVTTTSMSLYESGVLVGSMLEGPENTWIYTVSDITSGSKSYVARRVFAGGYIESTALTLTVLADMAPDAITTATLIAWYRVPESISFGATPEAAGTTPPGITFTTTGTLVRYEQIKITVPTGGARGTARLNVFVDDMTTPLMSNVLTAATILITGTDLTINCPAATYNTDNVYKSICNIWLDKVSSYPTSTNNYANTNVGLRPYNLAAANTTLGAPAIRFDGSNDYLETTGTVGTTTFSGTDHAFCHVTLIDMLAIPASGVEATIHSASNVTDTDQVYITTEILGTQPSYHLSRRGDTGTQVNRNSNIEPFTGVKLIESSYDGTDGRLTINTVDVIGGTSGVTSSMTGCGALTTTRAVFASRSTQSGRVNYGNFDLYEHIVFSTRPSDLEMWRLRAYFQR